MPLFDELTAGKKDNIYLHREVNLNSGIRFHSGYEFLFVHAGECELNIGESIYSVHAGQAVLVSPNVVYSWHTDVSSDCSICVFSEGYVPEFNKKHRASLSKATVFSLSHGDEIVKSIESAKNDYMLKGIFYCLLSMVVEESTDDATGEIAVSDKILEYIERNYSNDITLKDVSQALNYQYNYLSSLINKTFKMSFSKLLNKYRIFTAQQMLRTHSDKITTVATGCGYSSLRSFNRNFKKVTGQTPSEYLLNVDNDCSVPRKQYHLQSW